MENNFELTFDKIKNQIGIVFGGKSYIFHFLPSQYLIFIVINYILINSDNILCKRRGDPVWSPEFFQIQTGDS